MSTRTMSGSPAPRIMPEEEIIDDLRKIFKYRKAAKRLYQRIDTLTDKLLAKVGQQKEWELGPNRKGKLIDNFAQKNKCFRAHGIARYEFVEEEQ